MTSCFERHRPPPDGGAAGADDGAAAPPPAPARNAVKANESSSPREHDGLRRCIHQLQALTQQVLHLDGQCTRATDLAALEGRISEALEARVAQVAEELRAEWAAAAAAAAVERTAEGGDNSHQAQPQFSEEAEMLRARIQALEDAMASGAASGKGVPGAAPQEVAEAKTSPSSVAASAGKQPRATKGCVVTIDAPEEAEAQMQDEVTLTPKGGGGEDEEEYGTVQQAERGPVLAVTSPAEAEGVTELGGSIWDASIFIGHATVGMCGSLLVILLLVASILCQVEFLGFSAMVLAEEGFTEEDREGLRQWRMNIGQSAKYYDKMTVSSLSTRVCAQDPGMYPIEMSDGKSDLKGAMNTYLPGDDLKGKLFNGPLLCCVALMCWTLTVFRELYAIICRVGAIWHVPKKRRTRIVLSEESDKPYKLEALSCPRTLFALLICLARLAGTLALWGFGSSFLVNYSIDPAEIILNTVALEVVFSVDEAFFVLAPSSAKALFDRLQPLPRAGRVRHCRGLDCGACFLFVCAVFSMMMGASLFVAPLYGNVKLAEEILCSGNTEFIYALDANYMVYQSPANPFNLSREEFALYPTAKAIRELMYPDEVPVMEWYGNAGQFPMSVSYMGSGVDQVLQVLSMTQGEVSNELQALAGTTCGDTLSSFLPVWRFTQEVINGGGWFGPPFDLSSCGDVSGRCSVWPFLRSVCPDTCGCSNATAPLALVGPADGCPQACAQDPKMAASLAEVPCSEKAPSELSVDARWRAYAAQLGSKVDSILKDWPSQKHFMCNATAGNCTALFLELGCGIVDYWPDRTETLMGTRVNVCDGDYMGKVLLARPLAAICPITCNCTSTGASLAYCPTQC